MPCLLAQAAAVAVQQSQMPSHMLLDTLWLSRDYVHFELDLKDRQMKQSLVASNVGSAIYSVVEHPHRRPVSHKFPVWLAHISHPKEISFQTILT